RPGSQARLEVTYIPPRKREYLSMGSKKKAFAVIIPALALATSACQVTPGGAAAPQPGQSTPAAADGSDLDGGGGRLDDVKNPGGPGGQQPGGQQPGGQQPGGQQPGDGQQSPGDGQQPGGDQGDGQGDGQGNDQGQGDGQGNDQGQGDGQGNDQGQGDGQGDGQGNDQGDGQGDDQQVVIPELRVDQYVPIQQAPRVRRPRTTRRGSTGVFSVDCGTNEGQAHSNPDNVVAAPGVANGAHHLHDHV